MRFGVLTWSVSARGGGVQSFLLDLVDSLITRRPEGDQLVLFVSAANRETVERAVGGRPGVELVQLPGGSGPRSRLVQELADPRLGRLVGRAACDVLLVPSNVWVPRLRAVPQVVIVQAPLALPSVRRSSRHRAFNGHLRRLYYRLCFDRGLRRAARVVAVSSWVAQDLRLGLSLGDRRLVTIHEGVGFAPADHASGAADRAGPGGRSEICFVSSLFPYKGLSVLTAALIELGRRGVGDWHCTIVGRGTDRPEAVHCQALLTRAGLGERVELTGHLPRAEVERLLARSTVLVYPSELETFGIPPLEALAVGTTALVSRIPSLAELCGDAAVYFDAGDPIDLADKLSLVLHEGDSPARRARIERGKQVVLEYQWPDVADRYWALAADVARDGGAAAASAL